MTTRLLKPLGRGLRPQQWTKNGALLVPLLFARRATDRESLLAALAGMGAFCLLSSACYLANDIADRDADRRHPEKRERPLASGALSVRAAAIAAAILTAAGMGIAVAIGTGFAAAAGAYLILQALYSLKLKHWVVVDVFAIAAGFVLRVVAGGEAIGVPISNWLYLCALLLALFLALAKRRAELVALGDQAERHRPSLAEYSVGLLDQLLTLVSGATLLAYALYTVAPETLRKFGTDRLRLTVPFVLFGLFRYLYLVHRRADGGQPERVLLKDLPTQLNLLAYLAMVAWALY
jgi:4-hydroxybenzoate polyprenyltransferase